MDLEPETADKIIVEKLHTVTPLSKYLAMALFVVLPFLGGWIGYTLAPVQVIEVERFVYEKPVPESSQDSPVVWQTYVNKDFGFSFQYPEIGLDQTIEASFGGGGNQIVTVLLAFPGHDRLETLAEFLIQENPEKLSIPEFFNPDSNQCISVLFESGYYTGTVFNNHETWLAQGSLPVQYDAENCGPVGYFLNVMSPDKSRIVSITYPYQDHRLDLIDLNHSDVEEIHRQILETIVFLEEEDLVSEDSNKTYTNEAFGFSFQYGENQKLHEDLTPIEQQSLKSIKAFVEVLNENDDLSGAGVQVTVRTSDSLENILATATTYEGITVINGIEWHKYLYIDPEPTHSTSDYVLVTDIVDDVLHVAYWSRTNPDLVLQTMEIFDANGNISNRRYQNEAHSFTFELPNEYDVREVALPGPTGSEVEIVDAVLLRNRANVELLNWNVMASRGDDIWIYPNVHNDVMVDRLGIKNNEVVLTSTFFQDPTNFYLPDQIEFVTEKSVAEHSGVIVSSTEHSERFYFLTKTDSGNLMMVADTFEQLDALLSTLQFER